MAYESLAFAYDGLTQDIDYPAVHLGYLADKQQFDFERLQF